MSERQDNSCKDTDGRRLFVTVSKEFGLVKIEPDGGRELTMSLYEFRLLANWILELNKPS